jgi:hypothetical protein
MSDINKIGLAKLKEQASILSLAYKFGRERFAYSNLFTLVLPALLSSIVAVIAALTSPPEWFDVGPVPGESILAGLAAILVTIHKVLNCEDYQAECLRLSNVFKAIAYEADLTLNSSADLYPELTRLKDKLALEIENANATVPQRQIDKARVLVANGNYA